MQPRRLTNPDLERARQVQRTPTLPSSKKSGRVQDSYTAYNDFGWDKIEEYLKSKWPNWNFNATMFNAKWVFEVPESLTEVDRRELRKRRDATKRTRRPSVSPERAPEREREAEQEQQQDPASTS
ncbi:hypothetical protein ACJQWK_09552 [Exserohilum turcicum]|uniref:Uncharacterized protein n=1 Tax=Exserohilum turcicum (strain 28A) TaxID=671987 RepID=R0K8L7_EXST2|nr:uncharacterized protein SETTUDRAFT_167829 [Exserohilum turcica Et28A]EOA89308.1 hypothetical protein SETTUDRAFT_167829 [Exserohilum turcica Et28A]